MYKQIVVVGMTILLLLAPFAGVAGAALSSSAETGSPALSVSSPTDPELPEDQVHGSGHENVSIWDRSVLPLRTDLDAAEYTVRNQGFQISPPDNSGPHPADRQILGMFNTSENIRLDFEDKDGVSTENLSKEPATVIVGQAEPSADLANFEIPSSLSEEELEALNENMSFEEVADTSFDKNGELSSIEYETDEAGQYVAIVSTGDTDSSLLNNNELDPQGDSTIVGVEGFLVHSDSSTVDAPSEIEPGENATFEAETGLEGDDIAHGVVLYDEDEFTNTDTVINATTEPSSEFSMDDIVIERDVVGLNGVFSFQNETDHQRTTGETELEQLRDELHAMLDIGGDVTLTDDVETKAGDTYLTGSMTAIQTDEPKANLTVETYGNWSEHDDYRWIHVAADSDGEFETSTDVMELADEDDDTGGPGIPSPGPPEEPDYRVSDATLSDAKIAPGDSFEVSAKLQNVGEGTGPFIAELLVDGEVVDDQIVRVGPGEKDTITFTHSFNEAGEYEIAINDAVAGTVTVGDKEDETEATFDVTDATLSDTEIEIGDSVDASATVTNTGDETGTFTAELLVDGEVVDEETVQIFAGDETTVEFTKQFDEAGEYEIAINDADAGTLTVIEPGEDDDSAFPIPGFGPLAALLAIAISLFAIRFLPAQN